MFGMQKKYIVAGSVFGLIAPFIGIFLGLQVSVPLGNLFAFPVVGLAALTGQPFGSWHPLMMVLAVGISIAIWGLAFGAIGKLLSRTPSPPASSQE